MKKLIAIIGLLMLSSIARSADVQEPIYQAFTSNAFTVYVVDDATTSATVEVHTDSMTFVTSGGTTQFDFSLSTCDTIGELVAVLDAYTGISATLVQGCYDGNTSSTLTVTAATSCIGSTNAVTLALDNTLGMSYKIPAPTYAERIQLKNLLVNATFSGGTTYVNIYDGTATSDDQLRKERLGTSAKDGKLDIDNEVRIIGTKETSMRIDVVNATNEITAGYINILYEK